MNEKSFLEQFLSSSIQEAKNLVALRPKDEKFLNGWLNRISHISDYVGVKPAALAGGTAVILLVGLIVLITSLPKTRIA